MEIIEKWKVQDSIENYGIRNWGKGYFGINSAGHVTVHPTKDPEKSIDLKELIDQLQTRGIQLPILLRFTDILRHRIGEIYEAFRLAIQENDYKGSYCCVYPIKVNQQRHVVEEFLDFGRARSGVQTRALGRSGANQRPANADHLQWLQRR
jgi:arginine decarboxylase